MIAGAVGLVVLAGCSSAYQGAAQTPSTTPYQRLSVVALDRADAYTKVQGELTDFLDAWKTTGYVVASKEYLAPDLQATSADEVLVLTSGRVVTVGPDEWTSTDLFVVYVDFELTFAGSFGAWGNGRSSRFVTATARTGPIPYVLDFATGR